MLKTNLNIKHQPAFFRELLDVEKIIINDTIQLEPKKNNPRWLFGQSSTNHKTIRENVILLVERSKRDSKYGIKLRCKALTEEPFFRFDSDGPAHRNNFPEIPLEEQSVTTPHFNTFMENGSPYAYKNDTLTKEPDSKAISDDINFGLSLFCMETNSKLHDGEFPDVVDKVPEFEFGLSERVNFENISFD